MTEAQPYDPKLDRPNLVMSIPFLLIHLSVLLVFVTGVSWSLVALCVASYYLRMFGVTAGYHRYFSHRTYKTNRVFQFLLAWLAQSSAQKGALWWAAHHRHHHRYSDQPEDIHSPARRGFWWSHVGWILSDRYNETNYDAVKDLARFPELKWLNTFHLLPTVVMFIALFAIGGLPWVVWGGIVPTVLLWHGTFTINSLSHVFGRRRYLTTDTSRNNFFLALLTMGEGWHNNHHFHMASVNQGWFWWEVDASFYALKVLSWFGVVSDLRTVKDETKYAFRKYSEAQRAQLANAPGYRDWARTQTPPEVPVLGLGAPAPAMVKR